MTTGAIECIKFDPDVKSVKKSENEGFLDLVIKQYF